MKFQTFKNNNNKNIYNQISHWGASKILCTYLLPCFLLENKKKTLKKIPTFF
jgi:hypothetical protein